MKVVGRNFHPQKKNTETTKKKKKTVKSKSNKIMQRSQSKDGRNLLILSSFEEKLKYVAAKLYPIVKVKGIGNSTKEETGIQKIL
jgi:hypothetical protein